MRKKLSAWKDSASNRVSSLKNSITNWFDGKTTLTAMFGGSLVASNLLASKIAALNIPFYGTAMVPAGFVAIGLAFLCSDGLSELYGPEAAHRAVNGSIIAVAAALGLAQAAVAMPSAPFYPLGEEYAAVIGASASISIASVATMAVSQNLDVSVFHRIKEWGAPKWTRNVASTAVSQFVDTLLFITLAFTVLPQVVGGTVTPLAALLPLIGGQYAAKLLVAAADTPLFYAITHGSE